MRAFMAIELDKGLVMKAREIQESLRGTGADVKFVEPENLHFTVKFLGDIQEQSVDEVSKAVSEAVSGLKPLRVGVEGLGYFGSESHIKTLYLDVKEGREVLQRLLNSVNQALDSFRHDNHAPTPHLTLGRVKSGKNMKQLLEKLRELSRVKVGKMDVNMLKLKQSELTPKGPIYSDVKVFELV